MNICDDIKLLSGALVYSRGSHRQPPTATAAAAAIAAVTPSVPCEKFIISFLSFPPPVTSQSAVIVQQTLGAPHKPSKLMRLDTYDQIMQIVCAAYALVSWQMTKESY